MLRTMMLNAAFRFIKDRFLSDENIEGFREEFKDMVYDIVLDTENEWDDEAADALMKFMGMS